MEEIRACVIEQLRLATYGVASHVTALQTKTGTKDKIAQHWIDMLIQKARDKQAESPGKPHPEISNELLTWLGSQTVQPYNALLDMPCMSSAFISPGLDSLRQFSTHRRTHW